MNDFDTYFSDDSIIEFLCRQLIRESAKQREANLLHRIDPQNCPSPRTSFAKERLPSQRQCTPFRPRRATREKLNAAQINQIALYRGTLNLRQRFPEAAWALRLNETIARIRERIANSNHFEFASPQIRFLQKKEHEYRAISVWSDEDKVICGLTGKYLRERFDPYFHSSAIAFRASAPALSPSEQIDLYRQDRKLYVAEADIRGFFDTVDHNILRLQLAALSRKWNIVVDPRAQSILDAHLAIYSFPRNVLSQQERLQREKRDSDARVSWPREALLQFHGNPEAAEIGIPQGSAISCFLVNVLLHAADEAMELFQFSGHDICYMRHCDDMILLSPSQKTISRAFDLYLWILEALHLPVHPPKTTQTYQGKAKRDHWKLKSKAPYALGEAISEGQIPWFGFLGIQYRWDGLRRIRSSSLKKYHQKLRDCAGKFLRIIAAAKQRGQDGCFTLSAGQILRRFQWRLIAMSVGRIRRGDKRSTSNALCWAAGFRMFQHQKFPKGMFQGLDRVRELWGHRVKRALDGLRESIPPSRPPTGSRQPRFLGRPFSIDRQFSSGDKPET